MFSFSKGKSAKFEVSYVSLECVVNFEQCISRKRSAYMWDLIKQTGEKVTSVI